MFDFQYNLKKNTNMLNRCISVFYVFIYRKLILHLLKENRALPVIYPD